MKPRNESKSRHVVRGGPHLDSLYVQMPMLPNFLQVSADEKHWLTLSVKQIAPKVLRRVGRAWVEMLVKESEIKEKKRGK